MILHRCWCWVATGQDATRGPEHVHVATMAEQAMFVAVAELALFTVVAEMALDA